MNLLDDIENKTNYLKQSRKNNPPMSTSKGNKTPTKKRKEENEDEIEDKKGDSNDNVNNSSMKNRQKPFVWTPAKWSECLNICTDDDNCLKKMQNRNIDMSTWNKMSVKIKSNTGYEITGQQLKTKYNSMKTDFKVLMFNICMSLFFVFTY